MLTSCAQTEVVRLNGAGASFPFPLYSKYFYEYARLRNVQVNYQSIGSGAGQRQTVARVIHFGASDGPMKDSALEKIPGYPENTILHVPTALGAVVPIYNLEGISGTLRFNGPLLADIYLGKVQKWNDPALKALNPGVKLPDRPINVVHRSDGSGTSFVFTDYLSKVSPEWAEKVGSGTAVNWPTGIGGRGNEGVTAIVQQAEGSIGYVESVYADQNDMTYGAIQNRAGNFIKADPASVTAAAAAVEVPEDTRVSITDSPAPQGYPLASYTWMLAYKDLEGNMTRQEAQAVRDLLEWVVTGGQQYNARLGYAPLPAQTVERARAQIARLTYGGEPLTGR
nr:phosphate ABC transporter substrate-binding protein PstS [Deinobacterium chartae]